jgi:selenocysteine lyase/cysteine desulfurase
MIAMTHASNVVGTLMPVREVADIARSQGLLLLVDGAQSVGALPMDMEELGADLLVFTGHKALCGPTGTGGLVIGERVDVARLDPLVRGGTGSNSESDLQPDFLPDKFESGTMNVIGLAGLEAGVRWLLERGLEELRSRERSLTARLIEGLRETPGVEVKGIQDASKQLPAISFTIAGLDPGEVGLRLDEEFGIAARVGLHCSPLAHQTLGTFPTGTIRFSLGGFSTEHDVDAAVRAVRQVSEGSRVSGGAG